MLATRTIAADHEIRSSHDVRPNVRPIDVLAVLGAALLFVVLTRWPVARPGPFETDEVGYLRVIAQYRLPMHHTLFLALARVIGQWVGDPYRGFVVLDMIASAVALTSVWWWLRALVRPATALAATLALAVAPVFWSYGAMAGNYAAIVAVGSFLLGVAYRSWTDPKPWHPYAASVVLALGTGYRQDIGTFWLPVYFVLLWPHRWRAALLSLAVFTALNLTWLGLMLHDVGGWAKYRAESREFAYHAGYLNSVWNLGLIDAPVRYAVKLGMALVWTLGPGLLVVPRGLARLRRVPRGGFLAIVFVLSVLPALGSHLLVHFGVAGYAFHYVPALVALLALGIGRLPAADPASVSMRGDHAPARLSALAVGLAAVFLFYPTRYEAPGFRGNFDLSFARHTRIGLRVPAPNRGPSLWRTANSDRAAATQAPTMGVRGN